MIKIFVEQENINLTFDNAITIFDLISHIQTLPKDIIIAKVNSNFVDLSFLIKENVKVTFFTKKHKEILPILRHDTAHVLAEAVKILFPDAKIAIGPVIKDGFYYDFFKKDPFLLEDLPIIERKMKEIINNREKFRRKNITRSEALKIFSNLGEDYKVEIINSIPNLEELSIYHQGEFFDLCRGPHGPNTGYIKHFKLTKISSAFWRGDNSREMLQRIYGTAWPSKEDLDLYLKKQEEALKRDHRKLGKELSLFHFQHEAQGMVFWHDKGYTLYKIIQNYLRKKLKENDYIEVKTPVLLHSSLWKKSGHWEKFKENMFSFENNNKEYALKPMNCPCHIQIYNQGIKSYKDLPIRMSEFGSCYRNEESGALHGLLRVKNFVQDDAHIFCTKDQINSETVNFYHLLKSVYQDFGFKDIKIKFSNRPDVRAGSDQIWDQAENALKNAVELLELSYEINEGEGAFYGPKLEFVLTDAIEREWQCGTLQVDFVLPEKLGATYIDQTGKKQYPIILHRAILGTFERFIGILIEEYAGKFPLWLAPIQAKIMPITNSQDTYAKHVYKELVSNNIRTTMDLTSDKINYKIARSSLEKIPLQIILGSKEELGNFVSVRFLEEKKTKTFLLNELINFIRSYDIF